MRNSLILNLCYKLLKVFSLMLKESILISALWRIKDCIVTSIFQSKIVSSFLSYNQVAEEKSLVLRFGKATQQLVIVILSKTINVLKSHTKTSFILERTGLVVQQIRGQRANFIVFILGLSLMIYSLFMMIFNYINENLIVIFLISTIMIGLSIYDKDLNKSFIESKSRKILEKLLDYNY